jgi:hypothetical protein
MTERYEIRAGRSAPCELVSIVPTRWGNEAVILVCEGTHTYCETVLDRLQNAGAKAGASQ